MSSSLVHENDETYIMLSIRTGNRPVLLYSILLGWGKVKPREHSLGLDLRYSIAGFTLLYLELHCCSLRIISRTSLVLGQFIPPPSFTTSYL